MDYKAEYERITGRKWEMGNSYEPATLSLEEEKELLAALFGAGATIIVSSAKGWVWTLEAQEEYYRRIHNKKEHHNG